jgi:hypothetical protein
MSSLRRADREAATKCWNATGSAGLGEDFGDVVVALSNLVAGDLLSRGATGVLEVKAGAIEAAVSCELAGIEPESIETAAIA